MKLLKQIKRRTQSSKVLQKDLINPSLIKAEYAVRGYIPTLAGEMKEDLRKNPKKYKFKEIVELNIGNPLIFNTDPVWMFRKIISELIKLENQNFGGNSIPESFENNEFDEKLKKFGAEKIDIKKIANKIFEIMQFQKNKNKDGSDGVTEAIAQMIETRDGYQADHNQIFLSHGASTAIRAILELMIEGPRTGILIPIPQYPLYSGLITLYNGTALPYNLNESDNWNISIKQIAEIYDNAIASGIEPTAIVLINPGNPTGNIFDKSKMEAILEFAAKKSILILADEVYQENVYSSKPWYSFRKVLKEAPNEISKKVELISLHSLSKGILSECGFRGGYMEFTNLSPDFVNYFRKHYSSISPNKVARSMLLLKSKFLSGEFRKIASVNCFEVLTEEYNQLFESLKFKAKIATKLLNQIENMRSNEIEGAMYAFPQIILPKKMIQKAAELRFFPDVLYCKMMLEISGICIVPGSGFGQEKGTFHFRTTILPSPNTYFEEIFNNLKKTHEKIIEEFL